jgi:hypothetical protein
MILQSFHQWVSKLQELDDAVRKSEESTTEEERRRHAANACRLRAELEKLYPSGTA